MAKLDQRNNPTQGMMHGPAQRMMSRRTRTLLPTRCNLMKQEIIDPTHVKAEIKKKQETQRDYFDRSAKDLTPLEEGDVLRMQQFIKGNKSWDKAPVHQRLDDRSYMVELDSGEIYRRNRAHSGADLGNCGWGGGLVCVSKGEALDRGTKFRAGGGYGRGVPPSECRRKLKLETV